MGRTGPSDNDWRELELWRDVPVSQQWVSILYLCFCRYGKHTPQELASYVNSHEDRGWVGLMVRKLLARTGDSGFREAMMTMSNVLKAELGKLPAEDEMKRFFSEFLTELKTASGEPT